jgi:hypothetical protein
MGPSRLGCLVKHASYSVTSKKKSDISLQTQGRSDMNPAVKGDFRVETGEFRVISGFISGSTGER